MASITHTTVATAADDPSKEINKDQWNADHAMDGIAVTDATNVFEADQFIWTDTTAVHRMKIEGTTVGNYYAGFEIQTKSPNPTSQLGEVTDDTKGWFVSARSDANNLGQTNALFFAYWDGSNWDLPLTLDPATGSPGQFKVSSSWPLSLSSTITAQGVISSTAAVMVDRTGSINPRMILRTDSGATDFPGVDIEYGVSGWRGGIYYDKSQEHFVVFEGGGFTKYLVWHAGTLDKPVSVISKAGTATTSDVPSGEARVVKDTSGGSVQLVYNDGGTLKSVALV